MAATLFTPLVIPLENSVLLFIFPYSLYTYQCSLLTQTSSTHASTNTVTDLLIVRAHTQTRLVWYIQTLYIGNIKNDKRQVTADQCQCISWGHMILCQCYYCFAVSCV